MGIAFIALISSLFYIFSKRFLFKKRKRFFLVFDFAYALLQSFWLVTLFYPSGLYAFTIILSVYMLLSFFQALVLHKYWLVFSIEALRLWIFHYIIPFSFFEPVLLLDYYLPLDFFLLYCKSLFLSLVLFFLLSSQRTPLLVCFVLLTVIANLTIPVSSKNTNFESLYLKTGIYERKNDNITLRQVLKEIEQNQEAEVFIFSESIFAKQLSKTKWSYDYRIKTIQKNLKDSQKVILGFNVDDIPVIVSVSSSKTNILQQKKIFIPQIEYRLKSFADICQYLNLRIRKETLPVHDLNSRKFSIIICFEACFTFDTDKQIDFVLQFSEESFFTGSQQYGQFLFNRHTCIRSKEIGKPIIKVSNYK